MYLTDFAMESKIEIIQINISGEDKPGMTSSLTDILARYDAFILDIGQANIHYFFIFIHVIIIFFNNSTRISYSYTILWYIFCNNTIRPYYYVIAYCYSW